ncbi:hypothetical protein IEQ34_020031 [Dendrobium chrysotoxum]|uniref:Uncharacterized protein n=1 Tax=Dendrobium chrysotoxum TaxID=161865 RepID=A0AAV7GB09_DENCH|nr:hypothetical protein IEQ34_020031 [Dendrobium chrysotoxum]
MDFFFGYRGFNNLSFVFEFHFQICNLTFSLRVYSMVLAPCSLDVTKQFSDKVWVDPNNLGYIQSVIIEEFPAYCVQCSSGNGFEHVVLVAAALVSKNFDIINGNVVGIAKDPLCVVHGLTQDVDVVNLELCNVNTVVLNESTSGIVDASDESSLPSINPSLVVSEGKVHFVDLHMAIISNEELKVRLNTYDACVSQTGWMDDSFSSPGGGEGNELDGPEEDFNAMSKLNWNRLVEKVFSHEGGKRLRRKNKRK